jgi:hypothetical protein
VINVSFEERRKLRCEGNPIPTVYETQWLDSHGIPRKKEAFFGSVSESKREHVFKPIDEVNACSS